MMEFESRAEQSVQAVLALDDAESQEAIRQLETTHYPQRMYVGFEEGFKELYPNRCESRAQHIAGFLTAALTSTNERKVIIGPHPDTDLDAPYTAALWVERPAA